jgi:phage tail-like protein
MPAVSKDNYFFLNRDGRWPRFRWRGLELRDGGALQLTSVPSLSGALPGAVKTAPSPSAPAGIAVDVTGTLYFTDPAGDRVLRIDGCDAAGGPVPCIGGSGSQPGEFHSPRGLLILGDRRSLLVADSGNHRIQVFDIETSQLIEIWGQANPAADPRPGAQPGLLNEPWGLAADKTGSVYVVDYGNRRVQKFNVIGQVVSTFWQNATASGLLRQPSDVAVGESDETTRIFVTDAASATIYVLDSDGHPVLDSQGRPRSMADSQLRQPMGIAAAGDAVYVGDNLAQRILRFEIADTIEYAAPAIGYEGPVAALLLQGKYSLWAHPGNALTPVELAARGGHIMMGSLWRDPVQVVDRKVVWHRLWAVVNQLPANTHLDLYAYASESLADAPIVDPSASNPFADPKWQSIVYGSNLDVTDLYIGGGQSRYLWIGALFSGDGTGSPIVHQLGVEFDHPTYDQYLPAVYRNNANCDEFLLRLLSLFENMYSGVECEIASLPHLFDPKAAPQQFLAWLAGCLGLDLDDNWEEERQRRIIGKIFCMDGERGTVAGLREALRVFAGVNAIIEEPILGAAWWSMPSTADGCCDACAPEAAASGPNWQDTANSALGWTTMLAPAQPQGAVVGTSADLDQSHLIADTDFGAPLFTDLAYRFSVQLYRSQVMCEDALTQIRAILDQEKPAHTAYDICIIDPRFRVGFQSRVGIDTVVGGPPRSLALGSGQALGQDTALAGPDASRLGVESRLGLNTRLG